MALNLVDSEGERVAAENQPVEHSVFMGSPRKVGEDERVATFRYDNVRVLFSEEINKIENLLHFTTESIVKSSQSSFLTWREPISSSKVRIFLVFLVLRSSLISRRGGNL